MSKSRTRRYRFDAAGRGWRRSSGRPLRQAVRAARLL